MRVLTLLPAVALALLPTLVLAPPQSEAQAPTYSFQFGESGSGDGQFIAIGSLGLAPNGDVYATDINQHEVHRFDQEGTFITWWGGFGLDFRYVAVDGTGNVYITNGALDTILKYSSTGTLLDTYGGSGTGDGQFDNTRGIAIDSNGNLYVVDQGNNRVQKLSASGAFLGLWPEASEVEFSFPSDCAIGLQDRLYVANTGFSRIEVFDGSNWTSFGSLGGGDGQFSQPSGVGTDPTGNVYVTDNAIVRIQMFDADGNFLLKWGNTASFGLPVDVAATGGGLIYISDSQDFTIYVYDTPVPVQPVTWGELKSRFGEP